VFVFSPVIFWPWFAGLTLLVCGCFVVRREVAKATWLDKLIVLGPTFMAASIAVFGPEHLVATRTLMRLVPRWMPDRLVWAYFVGVALIAAAVSFVLKKYVRWSATLLGIMFFLFVLMIHLPGAVANPKDRILWTIAFRELAFAGGAWALASGRMVAIGRFLVAMTMMFFGVEHFLHPKFVPGVPLGKLMPAWVPVPALWGYLTGAVLLAAGAALLAGKRSRMAAAWAGLVVVLLVLFLYLPIFLMARQPAELNEALNYVADTLLFAGTVLCVARASPK
jgi:uncharacterized membrane protein